MDKYWYWITRIDGIGRKRLKLLLDYYITPYNFFHESMSVIDKIFSEFRMNDEIKRRYYAAKERIDEDYAEYLKRSAALGIKAVCIEDNEYPQKLKNIEPVPYVLYYKGVLPDENTPTISIVGARQCDEYGMKLSFAISKSLVKNGFQIISGLATGIDKAAHDGAVSYGKTYAVLGCGADICYPPSNINTYMDILNNGGVISEYPPGSMAMKHHFPERNRIISGLSDGILVVQAKKKSGSLITVSHALEQGRNVYALPGRVTDELSEGCLNLIKEGAKCVTCTEDILEDFEYFKMSPNKSYGLKGEENAKKIIENSLSSIFENVPK